MSFCFANRRVLASAGLIFIVWVTGSARGAEKPAAVDFNRDVRPILSKVCFNCHGPDAAHRKAGLRLDDRDGAVKELESGAKAIVPGKLSDSELYLRITSADDTERMPPTGSDHQLTPAQIETLKRWIEQGAPYARHWSFAKPQRPELPAVKDSTWPRNPIDDFILARQEASGLRPSPEADRYALIRRLSLDLRGLPPSPAEVQLFVNDPSDDAYEKLVDIFLGDSAYGERWARMWLDLARYADSKGLGSDPLRTIWRYRDWVIDAFNRNLPFDQFTIEQLAGDLLPDATLDQRIATAFHRNTMTNTEGGTDDEEFRVAAIKDRVDTTTQVWMGLTLGCAKCHDHKFDPLTQAEFYQFFAFFNQTADNDQPDESPTIPAPPPDVESGLREIDAAIAVVRKQIDTPTPELATAQLAWELAVRVQPEWVVLDPYELRSDEGATLERQADGSILVGGKNPDFDIYTISAATPLQSITAIRLEALPDPSLPAGGSGRASDGNFVLSKIHATVTDAERPAPPQPPAGDPAVAPLPTLEFSQALADFSQTNFPVESALKQRNVVKSGWGVAPHVQQPHTAYFLLASATPQYAGSRVTVQLEQRYQTARHTLGRFRLSVTSSPALLPRVSVPPDVLAIADQAPETRTAEQSARLAAYYRSVAPALEPARQEIVRLEKSRPAVPTVPVMLELSSDKRRTTKIMVKGNFQMTGEQVEAKLPANFHALPSDAPANRLGVAEWIVSRDNPLTARVMVNRFWGQLFGTGIVETEEDFGTQGDPPSHPELLDWLAVEFMNPSGTDTPSRSATPPLSKGGQGGSRGTSLDSGGREQGTGDRGLAANDAAAPRNATPPAPPLLRGGGAAWDMKRLLKLIVMSATYRQSSRITPDRLAADPRNRLLTRGPRFRLEAEMVRDQALALAGLLSRKTHGPSIYPPQPPGLWQAAFNGGDRNWATSTGEDKYRRGLYIFWRRTIPYPSMSTFDAPSRELCTVRRIRTNTPLQAFVTLNDPVYVEAAQALARRIVREGGATVADRARYALQLCLVHPPDAAQVAGIQELFEAELAEYTKDEQAARELATEPLGPLPPSMTAPELAAWTVVANVVLNLDVVLMKD